MFIITVMLGRGGAAKGKRRSNTRLVLEVRPPTKQETGNRTIMTIITASLVIRCPTECFISS